MSGDEVGHDDSTTEPWTPPATNETVEEIADRIGMFVAHDCGNHSHAVLAEALKRAATDWEVSAPVAIPKEGNEMDRQDPPTSQTSGPDSQTMSPPLPESSKRLFYSQDAPVWVFLASFAGLAIAWSSGGVATWVGALVGGTVAYLVCALVIASRG